MSVNDIKSKPLIVNLRNEQKVLEIMKWCNKKCFFTLVWFAISSWAIIPLLTSLPKFFLQASARKSCIPHPTRSTNTQKAQKWLPNWIFQCRRIKGPGSGLLRKSLFIIIYTKKKLNKKRSNNCRFTVSEFSGRINKKICIFHKKLSDLSLLALFSSWALKM